MKNGRICAVEFLHETDDKKRIAESMELFGTKGRSMGADGFEVWDHTRFIYRFVLDDAAGATPAGDGLKGRMTWLERLTRKFTLKRTLLASSHPARRRPAELCRHWAGKVRPTSSALRIQCSAIS